MPRPARPPKSLVRAVARAIGDYGMIRDGDRILLGVSGGKDSLSLLCVLAELQRYAPVRFELACATVDPEIEGFDPKPLADWMAAHGIAYHYRSQAIARQAETSMGNDSFCAFCSRMKRGVLYDCARRAGCNVLALGQHLDDFAESFLMSAFHGGRLQTMKAHYLNDAGDVRVIRPLAYVRERQTAAFAREAGLPVIRDNCPACFQMPTQRQHFKELLAREEPAVRNLFRNLLSAMRPLMAGDGREAPPAPVRRAS